MSGDHCRNRYEFLFIDFLHFFMWLCVKSTLYGSEEYFVLAHCLLIAHSLDKIDTHYILFIKSVVYLSICTSKKAEISVLWFYCNNWLIKEVFTCEQLQLEKPYFAKILYLLNDCFTLMCWYEMGYHFAESCCFFVSVIINTSECFQVTTACNFFLIDVVVKFIIWRIFAIAIAYCYIGTYRKR